MVARRSNPLSDKEPWNLVADDYEAVTRELLTPYSRAAVDLLAPKPTDRALDVACGPGTTSSLLVSKVAELRAIDFSPNMVAICGMRLSGATRGAFSAQVADGQNLPFEEASFDLCVSMFGLMYFSDRPRGFAELKRVLRPGGRALVSSWAPIDLSPAMELIFGALRAADPSLPAPTRDLASLENPEVLRSEMAAAGFEDVEIHEARGEFPARSPEEFWRVSTLGAAPLVMLRRQVGEDQWTKTEHTALEHLRSAWRPDSDLYSVAYLALGRSPKFNGRSG